MPNKKKIRNGFFYFMRDIQQECEARGERMSMASLQNFCSPKWNALPPEQKELYNARAKELKNQGASDLERKYDTLGVSFAAKEAQERELQEEMSRMKITIQTAVEEPALEDVLNKSFYFVHVNYYFAAWIDSSMVHTPCEIAMVEMSLNEGIIDTLHYIIHPGNIPLGMRGEAKMWAESTHGIPLTDWSGDERIDKEKNLVTIFSKVVAFLRRNSACEGDRIVLPPVYTMPDCKHNNNSLKAVQDAFAKFSEAAHEQRDLFRVYPLPQLFYQLERRFGDPGEKSSVAIWEAELVKDVFSYAPNLGCSFHENLDLSMHCSYSKVRRWAYTVCDHICPLVQVDLVAGKHLPAESDVVGAILENNRCRDEPSPPPVSTEPIYWKDDRTLTKMKELRIRDKERAEEELARAAELPLPHKFVDSLPSTQEEDFPSLGGFTVVGGRGKGKPITQNLSLAGGVWPVSGRGKLFKK